MKLVIDRERWLRGDDNSFLYRATDDKMCCLGFLAVACGFTVKEIIGRTEPADTRKKTQWPKGVFLDLPGREQSITTLDLMERNDNPLHEELDREAMIRELMEILDIEVEFIN